MRETVCPALFDEMMRGPSTVLRQSIFLLIGFFAFFIKTYLPPFYFLPVVVSFVGAALAFLYMRRKKREREYGYIKAEFASREEMK